MATHAAAAKSEGLDDQGTDRTVGQRLAPKTAHPSPLARCALRSQAPKVGAVCPNWARTVLCGGREVTRVPTAIHGQTRSFADVRAMSALPPEAVVERTSMDGRFVPGSDICTAANFSLFDHLVGAREHARWNVEAARLRCHEIDHQLEIGGRVNRKL